MTGLPTVEITQPTLPSPLPGDHQALMNIFYDLWQSLSAKVRESNAALKPGCDDVWIDPSTPGMLRSPHQEEIAAVMPPKVNAAVMLGNMHYQIGNGGWAQWHDNGYSTAAPALLQMLDGAAALGIENAADVAEMMRTFVKRIEDAEESRRSASRSYFGHDNDDEDFDEGRVDDDLCTRYYALDGEKLCQDILDRFEETVLQNFGAAAFKKAA